MNGGAYRSYLIRVWPRRDHETAVARLLVEEVQTGRRAELRGDTATALAATLEATLAGTRAVAPDPSASRVTKGAREMILVVGGTGMVGGEICRRLVTRGRSVRALVREETDPAKVAALEGLGIETVLGDLRHPSSLDRACAGVDALITTVSSMPFSYVPGVNDIATTDLAGSVALIDAARRAGVAHVVYTSFSANLDLEMPLGNAKRTVERHLRESGLRYTILRPSCFMEVWLSPAVGFDAANARASICGSGEAPVSYIAAGDVAEFAVRSLDSPAAWNATLELGGPEPISQLRAVGIFEMLAGRPFEVSHVPEDALEAQRQAATDPMQQSFAALMRCVARGDAIEMGDVLATIPVPLTSVRDYAARVLGVAPAAAR